MFFKISGRVEALSSEEKTSNNDVRIIKLKSELSTLSRANPTITLTPSSQSGTAGSTLTYIVKVTNNDPLLFGSSTFPLSYTIPHGWSATLSKISITVKPGGIDSSVVLTPRLRL